MTRFTRSAVMLSAYSIKSLELNEQQRDALKLLSQLPTLLAAMPAFSKKKDFTIFSQLSILSEIDGLEELAALSELSKLS